MQELTNAYAWNESLTLATAIAGICEEFSDAERNVLVWHLRQLVVDIPTGVAVDLNAGRDADTANLLKLGVVLALIKKIYPAIDTGVVEEKLEGLQARAMGSDFHEREAAAVAEGTAGLVDEASVTVALEKPLMAEATPNEDEGGSDDEVPEEVEHLDNTIAGRPPVTIPVTSQE